MDKEQITGMDIRNAADAAEAIFELLSKPKKMEALGALNEVLVFAGRVGKQLELEVPPKVE